jgi:hypothetical protein
MSTRARRTSVPVAVRCIATLAKLGLTDTERLPETIARRIIRAALAGERNLSNLTAIGVGDDQSRRPN